MSHQRYGGYYEYEKDDGYDYEYEDSFAGEAAQWHSEHRAPVQPPFQGQFQGLPDPAVFGRRVLARIEAERRQNELATRTDAAYPTRAQQQQQHQSPGPGPESYIQELARLYPPGSMGPAGAPTRQSSRQARASTPRLAPLSHARPRLHEAQDVRQQPQQMEAAKAIPAAASGGQNPLVKSSGAVEIGGVASTAPALVNAPLFPASNGQPARPSCATCGGECVVVWSEEGPPGWT